MSETAIIEREESRLGETLTAEAATDLDARIVAEMEWLNTARGQVDNHIATLGTLLLRFSSGEGYRLVTDGDGRAFHSFPSYLKARVEPFANLKTTQLYAYRGVAEHLAPYVSASQIEAMGITNASVLSRAVRDTQRVPPTELVEQGSLLPCAEFEQRVAEHFRITDNELPAGKWRTLPGFFASHDEWAEISRAFDLARRTDPPVSMEGSEGSQFKEVMLRLAREFIGTHEDGEGVVLGRTGRSV